jgi:RNA polymerase sigma-70 factor (ECF subfamily)
VIPYSSQTDRALLLATGAGDEWAFDAFYRRHREWVLAFLARRAPSPETAADLMAEVFADTLVSVLDGRVPEAPPAWLLTVARNKLRDSYRRGAVEASARRKLGMEPVHLEDADLERIVQIAEAVDVVAELRRHLSEDQVEVLEARILHERSYADIARELQCSEAVVRQRVSRALRTLRDTTEPAT